MRIHDLTLEEIRNIHPGAHIETFDAGHIEDMDGENILCLDVIVWPTEADSENDDGENAIARYLIADK